MLTIKGKNFGKIPTDNPVSLVYSPGQGRATSCFVKETSATEIKCRVGTDNISKKAGDTGTMVVFLKTSEEAKCEKPACAWTFTDTLPDVKTFEPQFDEAAGAYDIKMTGLDFPTDVAAVTLEIGGVA
jgi:hypothetical protein